MSAPVKRYEPTVVFFGDDVTARMHEHSSGKWASYTDYETVLRERDEARADAAGWKETWECDAPIISQLREERDALQRQLDEARAALLQCARMADALKRPCSDDHESPQAIRNGEYAAISGAAHVALGTIRGPASMPEMEVVKAERDALQRQLDNAPHEDTCRFNWATPPRCDCWKSRGRKV